MEAEEILKLMQTLSEIIVSGYLRKQSKEMSSNPVKVGEKVGIKE